jgi:hypothetical protein
MTCHPRLARVLDDPRRPSGIATTRCAGVAEVPEVEIRARETSCRGSAPLLMRFPRTIGVTPIRLTRLRKPLRHDVEAHLRRSMARPSFPSSHASRFMWGMSGTRGDTLPRPVHGFLVAGIGSARQHVASSRGGNGGTCQSRGVFAIPGWVWSRPGTESSVSFGKTREGAPQVVLRNEDVQGHVRRGRRLGRRG